jgi:hypothetical protein
MAGTVRIVAVNRHQSPQPSRQQRKRSQRPVVARAPRRRAEQHHDAENRWRTIRYAITSNARTVRLCVIMLIAGIPADIFALLHH